MAGRYISITLLLFLSCLGFNAMYLSGEGRLHALQALLYGPWGIVFGMYGWFANPLLGLAILLHRRWRWLSLLLGGGALVLALTSLGIERVPDNRSYDFLALEHFAPGFYLWLLSILGFCLGQAWWCRTARHGLAIPGWHWLDAVLAVVLGLVIHFAIQAPSLRFEIDRALAPPPYVQPSHPNAI
ncbi:hypothetical protein N5D52_12775 [Pseudomonas sp. GD03860]|uniref:hypothetical protein n=1 Tax=Pseudomonas sp. GD03860 TaxID=2975389 RepID=UPI00236407E4|nr:MULTISPECIES: hypothetical protein [Pseudomonas]MDD2060607.1 hypothetical protein [Pseudomonas putida]MDH0637817.1 hypothetical protein [Pseudomonas sp. GD03860]